MSKANTTETDLLGLVFNATALSWAGIGNLFVALHTADPGEGGAQNTSEVAYTTYARVAVSRDAGGWTVAGNTGSNTAQIQFPLCTAGSATATHVSIGTASTGAGQILYSGALASSLAISANITPQFAIAALAVQED